jgi:hypothetical protein
VGFIHGTLLEDIMRSFHTCLLLTTIVFGCTSQVEQGLINQPLRRAHGGHIFVTAPDNTPDPRVEHMRWIGAIGENNLTRHQPGVEMRIIYHRHAHHRPHRSRRLEEWSEPLRPACAMKANGRITCVVYTDRDRGSPLQILPPEVGPASDSEHTQFLEWVNH